MSVDYAEPALCCFPECGHAADFEIVDGEPAFDHYTHACKEHVGELLSDVDEQHVYRIQKAGYTQ